MKTKRLANTLSLIAALVACVGLSTTSYAANVIVNGDFSTGDFTGWTLFTTAQGNVTSSVTSFDVTGSGASLAGTFIVGGQAGFIGNQGGGIFQFVDTGAGTGTFSMNIAADNSGSGFFNGDGGTFSVLLDGVVGDSLCCWRYRPRQYSTSYTVLHRPRYRGFT
jgi:hypothetical protein